MRDVCGLLTKPCVAVVMASVPSVIWTPRPKQPWAWKLSGFPQTYTPDVTVSALGSSLYSSDTVRKPPTSMIQSLIQGLNVVEWFENYDKGFTDENTSPYCWGGKLAQAINLLGERELSRIDTILKNAFLLLWWMWSQNSPKRSKTQSSKSSYTPFTSQTSGPYWRWNT